jgi:hypothetical protein
MYLAKRRRELQPGKVASIACLSPCVVFSFRASCSVGFS